MTQEIVAYVTLVIVAVRGNSSTALNKCQALIYIALSIYQ